MGVAVVVGAGSEGVAAAGGSDGSCRPAVSPRVGVEQVWIPCYGRGLSRGRRRGRILRERGLGEAERGRGRREKRDADGY